MSTSAQAPPDAMRVARWCFVALLLLLTVSFLNSPGTGDVGNWVMWANRADTLGLAAGFVANEADYPPLATAVLLAAVRTGRLLGLSPLIGIKLTLLVFYVLTSLVVWRWTKDVGIAAIFHASVFLNVIAHGFIDIYFALPLVLALWAFRANRLAVGSALYTVSLLLKWQPLIIAPFVAVWVLGAVRRPGGSIDLPRLAQRVVAPALAVLVVTVTVFGAAPPVRSLAKALNHDALSANALNVAWVLTHALHVIEPERFGALDEGESTWIRTPPPWAMRAARTTFALVYAMTLVAFVRREKTFANLIRFAQLGYMAYFILNAGVHENHLFLPAMLGVILFWLKREEMWSMLAVILMSNINVLLFYGVSGESLGFHRVVAGRYDVALPIALVNVVFFAWLWASEVFRPQAGEASVQSRTTPGGLFRQNVSNH